MQIQSMTNTYAHTNTYFNNKVGTDKDCFEVSARPEATPDMPFYDMLEYMEKQKQKLIEEGVDIDRLPKAGPFGESRIIYSETKDGHAVCTLRERSLEEIIAEQDNLPDIDPVTGIPIAKFSFGESETEEAEKAEEEEIHSCWNCLNRDKCPGFNDEEDPDKCINADIYFPPAGVDFDKAAATLSEVKIPSDDSFDVTREIEKITGTAYSQEPSYSVTKEQAAYLRSKYDFNNMPVWSEECTAFRKELVEMNIISEEDSRGFGMIYAGKLTKEQMKQLEAGKAVMLDFDLPGAYGLFEVPDSSADLIDNLMSVLDRQRMVSAFYEANTVNKADKNYERFMECLDTSNKYIENKIKVLNVVRKIAGRISL